MHRNPPSAAAAFLGEDDVKATGGPLNIANFAMRAASEGVSIDHSGIRAKVHRSTSNSSSSNLNAVVHQPVVHNEVMPKVFFKNQDQVQR